MGFCEQCGAEVKSTANFCQKCGFKLTYEEKLEQFNADIKITHTNATTEKLLKNIGDGISKTASSTQSKLKSARKPIILIVVIGALLALVGFAAYYYYVKIYFPPITEFRDIKLSYKKEDVKFVKGEPDKVSGDTWYYGSSENIGPWLSILFDEDDVVKVTDLNATSFSCPNRGVYFYTYKDILNRFGEPSQNSLSDDKTLKSIWYYKYNLYFMLRKNQIVACGIE